MYAATQGYSLELWTPIISNLIAAIFLFRRRFLVFARCLDILAIAWKMVEGEVLYRKGLVGAGLESLREAARLDDALPYDEPWGWMQPARHALGALLLEQGRAAEAAEVHVDFPRRVLQFNLCDRC